MFFSKMDRNTGYMNRMMETAGVDVADELFKGTMQANDLRNQFYRCVNCSHTDACQSFLAAHEGEIAPAPDFCPNSTFYNKLVEG